MGTVICGGGIIGLSTAYYLSQSPNQPPNSIHVVESSPRLFASASGYAGGFLAKDWFSQPVASLGALSFDLHKELAQDHGGKEKWGYSRSTAFSYAAADGIGVGDGTRGEDWLRDGTSRAQVANGQKDILDDDGTPAWLTKQKRDTIEKISDEDTAAQVDPLHLCEFLLESCLSRCVQLHHPAHIESITTDPNTNTLSSVTIRKQNQTTTISVSCASLVITAGAWTPAAFSALFPKSNFQIPISPLAGHSLVLRSPRHTLTHEEKYGGCHAVFTAPTSRMNFAPEIISRQRGEIYIAGLNSSTILLPEMATGAKIEGESIQELKRAAVKLMGASTGREENEDDLEVIREGLCFRPVTRTGRPIVSRVGDEKLGGVKTKVGGGVFVAAGHGPWGISLSLGTGCVVSEMVEGRDTSARVGGLKL